VPNIYNLSYIFSVLALLGLIPALVALRKGRSTFLWWLFGFSLPIVAIPSVFLVQDLNAKNCPRCVAKIKREWLRCRHCGFDYAAQDDWRIS
jgi:hypothetical protein